MCLLFVVEKEKHFPYMMVGRSIFLDFNRNPYERCFYLLLSKDNQVIND